MVDTYLPCTGPSDQNLLNQPSLNEHQKTSQRTYILFLLHKHVMSQINNESSGVNTREISYFIFNEITAERNGVVHVLGSRNFRQPWQTDKRIKLCYLKMNNNGRPCESTISTASSIILLEIKYNRKYL